MEAHTHAHTRQTRARERLGDGEMAVQRRSYCARKRTGRGREGEEIEQPSLVAEMARAGRRW